MSSVTQLDVRLTGDQEVVDSTPTSWQHSLVEADHEIFSKVIVSADSGLELSCRLYPNRLGSIAESISCMTADAGVSNLNPSLAT